MSDLNNDFQTQELIKKFELLRDLEAEKPIEEMDVSLLTTCVEFILELRGETEMLSPEEVEEKVRKIPFVDTTSLNTTENVKSKSTNLTMPSTNIKISRLSKQKCFDVYPKY